MITQSKTYCVTDYGAKSNGNLCTEAFQKAIDDCFLGGGGEVVVPTGEYLTGGIRLRSGVTLHLMKNAVVKGSVDPEDYFSYLNDTIEPILSEDKGKIYTSLVEVRSAVPCSRWNNAIIRAIRAENISIIGEEGSVIDGQNCFDKDGEENYRGPHAINFWLCKNIVFKGYTVKDSANWAHAIFNSKNVYAENLTVLGGHDGFDVRTCDNVKVENCRFYTGDDCLAGFDNVGVHVDNCVFNCACSFMRFGGTDVLIENCIGYSPSVYGFRGHLSQSEKQNREPTNENCRHQCHHVFQYYCDERAKIRKAPENIVIRHCSFKNAKTIFESPFGAIWCNNRSIRGITFDNCVFEGVSVPIKTKAPADEPLNFVMRDCTVISEKTENEIMEIENNQSIVLDNVKFYNFDKPLILCTNISNIDIVGCKPDIEVKRLESEAK